LLRSHADGLDAELAATEVEEVFQVRTQEVNNEDVVETLLSEMVDLRNTDCVEARGKSGDEYSAGCKKTQKRWGHIRVPFKVRYDRYSSRS
jgi:hypothetical protein